MQSGDHINSDWEFLKECPRRGIFRLLGAEINEQRAKKMRTFWGPERLSADHLGRSVAPEGPRLQVSPFELFQLSLCGPTHRAKQRASSSCTYSLPTRPFGTHLRPK